MAGISRRKNYDWPSAGFCPKEPSLIRPYQAADCEAILRVWSLATAVAHPFLDKDFLQQEYQNIPALYLPLADTWVWQSEQTVVGFMSLLGDEIGAIFIDPTYHRQGIGRAMITFAQQLHTHLEVEVFEQNLQGRRFYAQMGFKLLQKKIHDQTGCSVLRLRRS
jgi:putative acetyltransferase